MRKGIVDMSKPKRLGWGRSLVVKPVGVEDLDGEDTRPPAQWYQSKSIVIYREDLGTVEEAAAKGDKKAQFNLESNRKRGIDVSKVPFYREYSIELETERGPPIGGLKRTRLDKFP